MYAVSEDYLNAIHSPERFVDIKGNITFKGGAVIAVNNNSFQESSLYINKKAVDADNLNAGSVYASELGVSIFYDKSDYKSFIGAIVTLSFGIEITLGQEDFEYIPLGSFRVDTAEKGAGVVKLVAYDYMLKFDKEYPYQGKQASIYEHLSDACSKCGVVLGMSKSEIESLPSGNTAPVINPTNMIGRYTPCETYRDLISIIAGHSGAFAYIGRDNKLYLKTFIKNNIEYQLTNEQIFSTTTFDCNPAISSVSYTYYRNKNAETITVGDRSGRDFLVDNDNQLYENAYSDEVTRILTEIYKTARTILYVPAEITWSGDPAIDLGDYIRLPEYEGGCETLVTGINWKYRGKSKITAAGKENSSMVKSSLSKSITAAAIAIEDLSKTVEEIVTPPKPIDNGDHIKIPLQSVRTTNTTISTSMPLIYYDYPGTITGSTIEKISGTKSIDNPSVLSTKTVNGVNLYSLPDGTSDTATVNEGLMRITHKCGRVIIDGDFTDVYAWRHSGASNVPDGYFCVSWLSNTVTDKILANTVNIYCNMLEPVGSVMSSETASLVISATSGIYVVLPTGICDETNESLHNWLTTHPIKFIYPIANPYSEEISIL